MEDSMMVSDGKYRLKVFRDEFAESPREYEGNLGKMVCWHRKYLLGDEHDFSDPQEFQESEDYKNAYLILPVYLYDHSGITISTSDFGDRWDSGQIGYIYVTREKIREVFGKEPTEAMRTQIEEELIDEVSTYDQYLQGDCYRFEIQDRKGNMIDCAGGYFGDRLSEVLRQMKESAPSEHEGLFEQMERHSAAFAAMM